MPISEIAMPFTDCREPFKHLNGKMSLEVSLKKDVKFPKILGIEKPKAVD